MNTDYDFDAVLLDIEGTITPISFVYDTLFPYAHDHLERFLDDWWDDTEVHRDVAELIELANDEGVEIPRWGQASRDEIQEAVAAFAHGLMHADRKDTALKSLQGKIWRDGYERGQLRGEFYDDALRAIARWHAADLTIAIYSSGSVEAQQLLFRHTREGDLTSFVSEWFDTTTGGKRDADSYENIAEALHVDASRIMFCTDVVAEAEAAHEAGFQVRLVERLGNPKRPPHEFAVETDLEML